MLELFENYPEKSGFVKHIPRRTLNNIREERKVMFILLVSGLAVTAIVTALIWKVVYGESPTTDPRCTGGHDF